MEEFRGTDCLGKEGDSSCWDLADGRKSGHDPRKLYVSLSSALRLKPSPTGEERVPEHRLGCHQIMEQPDCTRFLVNASLLSVLSENYTLTARIR